MAQKGDPDQVSIMTYWHKTNSLEPEYTPFKDRLKKMYDDAAGGASQVPKRPAPLPPPPPDSSQGTSQESNQGSNPNQQ